MGHMIIVPGASWSSVVGGNSQRHYTPLGGITESIQHASGAVGIVHVGGVIV